MEWSTARGWTNTPNAGVSPKCPHVDSPVLRAVIILYIAVIALALHSARPSEAEKWRLGSAGTASRSRLVGVELDRHLVDKQIMIDRARVM